MQKQQQRGLFVFNQDRALDERLEQLATKTRGHTTIHDKVSNNGTSNEESDSALLGSTQTRSRRGTSKLHRQDEPYSDQQVKREGSGQLQISRGLQEHGATHEQPDDAVDSDRLG